MLEVASPRCRQGGLKRCRPVVVGPGEAPHLVGGQAKVTEYRPEWLAAVDRVEEVLPYLNRQPLLRSDSSAGALVVSVRSTALGTVAPAVPTRVRAVPHSTHRRTLARTHQGCD